MGKVIGFAICSLGLLLASLIGQANWVAAASQAYGANPLALPTPQSTPDPLDKYRAYITNFLNKGEHIGHLEAKLRRDGVFGAISQSGGIDNKIVVVMLQGVDPARAEVRLLIFHRTAGKVDGLYDSGTRIRNGGGTELVQGSSGTNGNDEPDVAFFDHFCGAHTCYDTLHLLEWDGTAFRDLIDGDLMMPYPQYILDSGQITAVSGRIQSAGAGAQRAYTEIWQWNGDVFTVTHQVTGPPTVRMHIIHDGDDLLSQGAIDEAMIQYHRAITDTQLPATSSAGGDIASAQVIISLARFKLVVAQLANHHADAAIATYEQLQAEIESSSPGHIYLLFAQGLLKKYTATADLTLACAYVTELATEAPDSVQQLYVGYGSKIYEPADLCLVPPGYEP